MSDITGRLYRISKAYLNQVRDRIDSELTEREARMAEREMNASPGDSLPADRGNSEVSSSSPGSPYAGSDIDGMMRRAEERIAAARRDLESRTELAGRSADAPLPPVGGSGSSSASASGTQQSTDPNASDYRVLGLPVGSDLSAVQSAYEKLTRRCDPRRFPDGSAEQKDAERILERVNKAYEALHARLDPTINRFGKLEF